MKGPQNKSLIGNAPVALRKMLDPLRRGKYADHSVQPCDGLGSADDAVGTIIESDIVPRLLMAHTITSPKRSRKKAVEIDDAAVSRFASLPMEVEAAELMDEVDRFLSDGIDVETVYVDLLAPTARALGESWERDECDFIEVTMGLWRLQEVMREIGGRYPSLRQKSGPSNCVSALFSPMPGDDHSFGALMIDDVFARAGWNSEAVPQPERRELLDTVSRRPFDLIGLTVTRECPPGTLRNLILALRKASNNPQVAILIGGHFVNNDPAIVAEVGADGTGTDARAALDVAGRLVASAQTRVPTQE